ncbi:Redoxin [Stieleria maiorica]|uniref:Redoxin n=1 Tax=Stieleria maiorica TaxID=2795974 RepID=A0A5B9MJ36_9BACT|nr:redoxin family protein [Stieleria maiorica]QEG01383.1 Redoxin [Stieleria maiorica]
MKPLTFQTRRSECSRVLLTTAVLALLLGSIPGSSTVRGAGPDKPLAVGDKAPDFELPIQGQSDYVTLSQLNADGPVVVVVLRGFPGYQCPICNRQVGAMINRAKTLSSALGDRPNRVVLVYPGEDSDADLERRAKQFLGARRLPEPMVLVRDPGMEMITSWGLRWDARRETAYPSAYVIGVGRRVAWSKVSDSHGGRASVEEILQALKNL